MKALKIVGKQHNTGEYKGNNYDNTMLHVVKDFPEKAEAEGLQTEAIKIKASVMPYDRLNVGDVIEAYYDRFGNVCALNIIKTKGESKD